LALWFESTGNVLFVVYKKLAFFLVNMAVAQWIRALVAIKFIAFSD
jgi:hypothetical protein